MATEEFINECLEAHNEYRRKHGVKPLTLDPVLCGNSQNWANVLAAIDKMQLSETQYGENVFYSWSSDVHKKVSGRAAVDRWYEEIKYFTFGEEPQDLRSGHFTQIVWKESERLGVGMAKSGSNKTYVVCHYDPAGNWDGRFAGNVLPNSEDVPTRNYVAEHGGTSELSMEVGILEAHNYYRALHGVKPLEMDSELCEYSQNWANILAQQDKIEHSMGYYGENIYAVTTDDPNYTVSGNEIVAAWYQEIKYFTFGQEPTSSKTGHFTQVIWRDSERLGVGAATSSSNTRYVVVNYDPPGNFHGHYARKVPPPVSAGEPHPMAKARAKESPAEQFEREVLEAHNAYRAMHGSPPLALSKELCKSCSEWAKALAKKGTVEHRTGTGFGESLFVKASTNPNYVMSGNEPVDKWYSEINDHDFTREPTNTLSGHFTQVVWKNTKELGVGMAKGKGKIFVVAAYIPAGNMAGEFKANVLPKTDPSLQ